MSANNDRQLADIAEVLDLQRELWGFGPVRMGRLLDVTIELADLTHAECGDPGECLVAQAVQRTTERAARVGHSTVKVWQDDEERVIYVVPERVRRLIEAFDASEDNEERAQAVVAQLPLSFTAVEVLED